MKKIHEKKGKDDIFGTQSKLPLGPSDYEVNVNLIKQKTTQALGFNSKSATTLPDEV